MTDELPCPICLTPFFTGREFGGHAKTHKHKRADKPDCFTDVKEWEYTFTKLRIEHPGRMMTPAFALSESCAECPLEFMLEMQSKGRCHPPAGAIPQRDVPGAEMAQAFA